jgi:ATP-dependent RNA helicase SUPV3L1/SUV3
VCGYRICGARVVRIDMLERLADLIRDRVFWKARFPEEPRPAGSFEGGGFTIVPDMMSLVGCSGEEFHGILKSLGFRVQKKSVTREAAAPAQAAPIDMTAPTGAEVEQPAVIAEIADPVAAETAAPAVEAVAAEPVAEAPAAETVEIDVWWPKDTGPFRHKPKTEAKQRPPRQDNSPEQRKTKPKPKPKFDRPPRRPEKPIDPNSPFAILGQLKSQMAGQKR